MNSKISLIVLICLLLSCRQEVKTDKSEQSIFSTGILMEADSLLPILDQGDLAIIDFRKPEFYNEAHIPGSVNIWRTDLENPNYPYGGMMPEKEDIELLLSRLGISNKDQLIIYDDNGSIDASRLWWLLSYYYYDKVKVLNGGLSAWRDAGGTLSNVGTVRKPANFYLPDSTRSNMLIGKAELKSSIERGGIGIKLVDVRSIDEYSGKVQKSGALKAGRIPGSVHIEWSVAIDTSTNKFRTEEDLSKVYRSHGINPNDTIVVYCHSGSRSAHSALVLEALLNFEQVKNYDGSWTEWSHDNDLPFETDSLIFVKN